MKEIKEKLINLFKKIDLFLINLENNSTQKKENIKKKVYIDITKIKNAIKSKDN